MPASASASAAVTIDLTIEHLPIYSLVVATSLPTTEVEFGPETELDAESVLQLSPATVAFRVFRAAAAFIKRYVRILADEPFPGFHPVFEVRDDQLFGGLALFFPLFDQAERIEVDVFGAVRAGAVAHAGHHEKSHRFLDGARPDLGDDGVVVVDRDLRRHGGVGPAVHQQQLAAAREEPFQIRIDRVHRLDLRSIR